VKGLIMRKTLVSSLLVAGVLAFSVGSGSAAADDAKPSEIYNTLRAGHVAQAEQMIDQVVHDNPSSGRAHYIAAEVYARANDYARARQELATARNLEPSLPFATQRSVQELQAQLYGGASAGTRSAPVYVQTGARPHVPWGLIIIIAAIVAIIWMIARRRRAMYYGGAGYGYPTAGAPGAGPYPPGAGPYPYGPGGVPYGGGGGGLMSGLGTGLAVGAGVAAGEELVHHVLDGRSDGGVIPSAAAGEYTPPPNADMGGQDFGVSGDSWDDNSGGGGGDLGGGGGGGDDWT
jgi:uncharacterized protein